MCELHVSPHSPDTSTADTAFYTSMSFLHFAKLLAFPLVFIGETWAYTPPKTEVPKEEERRVFLSDRGRRTLPLALHQCGEKSPQRSS